MINASYFCRDDIGGKGVTIGVSPENQNAQERRQNDEAKQARSVEPKSQARLTQRRRGQTTLHLQKNKCMRWREGGEC